MAQCDNDFPSGITVVNGDTIYRRLRRRSSCGARLSAISGGGLLYHQWHERYQRSVSSLRDLAEHAQVHRSHYGEDTNTRFSLGSLLLRPLLASLFSSSFLNSCMGLMIAVWLPLAAFEFEVAYCAFYPAQLLEA